MTTADALRWLLLLAGCFVLGALGANYMRAWRWASPTWPVRQMIVAVGLLVAGVMEAVWSRLGAERFYLWRAALAFVALLLMGLSLAGTYRWTRTPEGRRLRHRLIAEVAARKLERQVDQASDDQLIAETAREVVENEREADRADREENEGGTT